MRTMTIRSKKLTTEERVAHLESKVHTLERYVTEELQELLDNMDRVLKAIEELDIIKKGEDHERWGTEPDTEAWGGDFRISGDPEDQQP